jgi:hypothetical protein
VFKKYGLKALAMVASLGMTAVLVGGCNPAEEPVKPAAPPTTTTAPKPKADDKKGDAPAPISPAKDSAKTK